MCTELKVSMRLPTYKFHNMKCFRNLTFCIMQMAKMKIIIMIIIIIYKKSWRYSSPPYGRMAAIMRAIEECFFQDSLSPLFVLMITTSTSIWTMPLSKTHSSTYRQSDTPLCAATHTPHPVSNLINTPTCTPAQTHPSPPYILPLLPHTKWLPWKPVNFSKLNWMSFGKLAGV